MLNTIRLVIALFVILLLTPQTPKFNLVLRVFHESGFFMDYAEAKSFLTRLSWISIFIFVILLFF